MVQIACVQTWWSERAEGWRRRSSVGAQAARPLVGGAWRLEVRPQTEWSRRCVCHGGAKVITPKGGLSFEAVEVEYGEVTGSTKGRAGREASVAFWWAERLVWEEIVVAACGCDGCSMPISRRLASWQASGGQKVGPKRVSMRLGQRCLREWCGD